MMGSRSALRPKSGLSLVVALSLAGSAVHATGLSAQTREDASFEGLGIAATNALAGGVSAAVIAAVRGGDVTDAFLKGAVGGAVVYAGKRVAVEGFAGAGLIGRQVGALGSSVVANGGWGRGWLDVTSWPLGPLWIEVHGPRPSSLRANVWDIGALAWAIYRPELRFDWRASLSNGAMVFASPYHAVITGDGHAAGFALAGMIVLGPGTDHLPVQAHENVHVIQHDFLLHVASRPVEAWAWGAIFGRSAPVDLDIFRALPGWPPSPLLEAEAEALTRP